MLLDKQFYYFYSQASPLIERYMDLCFSHSLHQLIAEPTRTNEHTRTLIDYILRNSTKKGFRVALLKWVYLTISIYCTRKMSFLNLNEHCEISIRSMKNYSDKTFVEQLRAIRFPYYTNYTCVNDAYQDFVVADVVLAFGIDQISAKFLKDGLPVIVIIY